MKWGAHKTAGLIDNFNSLSVAFGLFIPIASLFSGYFLVGPVSLRVWQFNFEILFL